MSILPCRRTGRFITSLGLAAAVTAGSLVTMSGCASGGGGRLSASQRDDRLPIDHEGFGQLGYRMTWKGFPDMSARGRVEHALVFDDVVVVQDNKSLLSVMDATSGRTRWSDPVAGPLTQFVGAHRLDGRILSVSDTEVFVYDIDTGALVDRQSLDYVANTPSALVGDAIVFGTAHGLMHAHRVGTGLSMWTNSFPDRAAVRTEPVQMDSAIGFVSDTGGVVFLDPMTGGRVGTASMYDGAERSGGTNGGTLFVASRDHSLYAIRALGGEVLWRHATDRPLTNKPVFVDERVYLTIDGDGVHCFDAQSGVIYWKNQSVSGTVVGQAGQRVLVWDGSALTGLHLQSGEVASSVSIPNTAFVRMAEPIDGELYVFSTDGAVARFDRKR